MRLHVCTCVRMYVCECGASLKIGVGALVTGNIIFVFVLFAVRKDSELTHANHDIIAIIYKTHNDKVICLCSAMHVQHTTIGQTTSTLEDNKTQFFHSSRPSTQPTAHPSTQPTAVPTRQPSAKSSSQPSTAPSR